MAPGATLPVKLIQKVSSTLLFARIAPHFIPAMDKAVHRLTAERCCSAPACCPG